MMTVAYYDSFDYDIDEDEEYRFKVDCNHKHLDHTESDATFNIYFVYPDGEVTIDTLSSTSSCGAVGKTDKHPGGFEYIVMETTGSNSGDALFIDEMYLLYHSGPFGAYTNVDYAGEENDDGYCISSDPDDTFNSSYQKGNCEKCLTIQFSFNTE